MQGPLHGITILDLTIYQNGPWGTVMLSDMGAEVIKVEDPVNGDPGRALTPMGRAGRRVPTYFESMNRNKRSITLNLKSDDGREVFYDLAKRCDVITQNFRVGVVERLKVDYETVRKINPRIVYASVSGLGSRGPEAKQGVFDILGQARGGLMELLSIADPELSYRSSGGLADQTGAITMAYGIMLALFDRERTGKGQHVEVSQLGGQLMLQALALNGYLMNDELPLPRPRATNYNPLFNIYRCKDDRWIALGGIQPDRYWPALCEVLGIEELRDDPRFSEVRARGQHAGELIPTMDRAFVTKTRDEWIVLLRAKDVLCGPVQKYDDIPNDPQVIANELLVELEHPEAGPITQVGLPVRLSETPGKPRSTAPEFGAHTEEVLQDLGLSWERIVELRDRGII